MSAIVEYTTQRLIRLSCLSDPGWFFDELQNYGQIISSLLYFYYRRSDIYFDTSGFLGIQ